MEYQLKLALVMMSLMCYITRGMCAPYGASISPTLLEDSAFSLIEDKDVDLDDQAENIVDLATTLIAMGYMKEPRHWGVSPLNKTEMSTQIPIFQKNAGIKVTGTITSSTMVAAKSPRCGRSDVEAPSSASARKKLFSIYGFPIYTAGSKNKWKKNRITWRMGSYPTRTKMTHRQVMKDIKAAFKTWSDVTPLEFVQVSSDDADIRIEFAKKRHGEDAREPPFDGRGGTLAHAFYPNSGWRDTDGDVHFDDDEVFTYKDKEFGTNLFYTAAHAIGHSLGLPHSSNPKALMNPWDRGYVKNFKLPKDDELAVQILYGIDPNLRPSGGTEVESTTPEPEPVVTTETVPRGDCENEQMNIAVTIIDNSLFVFRGEYLWRYQGDHVNQRLLTPLRGFQIRRYFKDGPKSIDAAFTYKNGSAVFIKGRNMWVFNVQTRQMVGEPGLYPVRVKEVFGIPRDIDAAFQDHINGVAYFFKGDQLWKYDTEHNRLISTAEGMESRPAEKEFHNFPNPLNGAYSDLHGNRYLIQDRRYWKYNAGEKAVAPEYPKMFAFLDCH